MKRGAWVGAAVLLAALVLVPVSWAARGGGRMARMADALDLTPEQRTQVSAIIDKYRGGPLGDHQRDLREARTELRRTIHDVKATDAQVQQAAQDVAAHASFVAVERHRMAVEIDRVLTDAQRQKAAELRESRRERRGESPRGESLDE